MFILVLAIGLVEMRPLLGGVEELDVNALDDDVMAALDWLKENKFTLVELKRARKQIVAGVLYSFKGFFTYQGFEERGPGACSLKVLNQPWMSHSPYRLVKDCCWWRRKAPKPNLEESESQV